MNDLSGVWPFRYFEIMSRSVPGGCVIGFFGALSFCFSGICLWGLWEWWTLPVEKRPDGPLFQLLIWGAPLGLIAGALLCRFAIRVHKTTDFKNYDPSGPDQNRMKW